MGKLTPPLQKDDHILGLETAPITLVEYGDYQCFHCRQVHQMVDRIRQQLGDRLCFAFRHFPLTAIHPYAQYAAEVAEAANAQGRFWEIHDYLFTHQQRLGNGQLLHYAASLGIDCDRFEQEIADHRHAAQVCENLISGIHSGVNGTPTFFINGDRYNGAYTFDAILATTQRLSAL
ncbi:DsbA family protein [Phormidesmis sp. 146-35]